MFKVNKHFVLKFINKTILFGLFHNSWIFLSGPITLFLIVKYFAPEVQGFYYTFSSLIGLQIFVELGLSTVIISYASHEWAKLKITDLNNIEGNTIALSRLSSLSNLAIKWYFFGGILVSFFLFSFGYYFFSKNNNSNYIVDWLYPWLFLSITTGVNMWFSPFYSILEGCNQIEKVYKFKFILTFLTSIVTWLSISFGASLWVLVINSMFILIFNFLFFYKKYRYFFKQLFYYPIVEKIKFIEIWPMQWKIALSFISGYFFSTFFTPLTFKISGPISAGQIGLTFLLLNALGSLSVTWIVAERPRWGMLVSKKEYTLLDKSHKELTLISSLIFLLGIIFLYITIKFFYSINHQWSTRFLPPNIFLFFAIGMLAGNFTTSFSYYLRAHNIEPLLIQSLSSAIFHLISAIFLGSKYGLIGIAISYFTISILYSLPYVLLVWYNFKISKKIS